MKLLINGQTWRIINVETAADEGALGTRVELFQGSPLGHFGLPSPVELAGIALDYQVAQKVHACTDPHEPPDQPNDRARDLVDLHLIRKALYSERTSLAATRAACVDLFSARADDARALGFEPRPWPPKVQAHDHWRTDFASAAGDRGLDLDATVDQVNDWIRRIDAAGH